MVIKKLGEREYRMLEIIDKLRIVQALELAWLAGFTDVTFCRKKLMELVRMGLLQTVRDCLGAKCYFLTAAGMREIGKSTGRTYEVSYTTYHALMVGRACTWLCITDRVSIFDMIVDRDMMPYFSRKAHRPDIVLRGKAFEVELNHKPIAVLERNIVSNDIFEGQTWLVPDKPPSIGKNIQTVASRIGVNLLTMPLSCMDERILMANIHHNTYIEPAGVDVGEVLREAKSKESHSLLKYRCYKGTGAQR